MARFPALPWIRASVTNGLSANQALQEYKQLANESGLSSMRRQDFLRLFSEVRSGRGNVGTAMGAPKNSVPSADQIQQRTTIRAKGHGAWVTVWQRTRGQNDLIETRYLMKSEQPLTPAEAEARAQSFLMQPNEEYDRITLGLSYTGSEFYTPKADQYE